MAMPSAFAVLRLMISSNLVTCWVGRSAGFAPLPPGRLKLATRPPLTASRTRSGSSPWPAWRPDWSHHPRRRDYGHPAAHKIGCQCGQAAVVASRPAEFNRDVLALNVAALILQAATECPDEVGGFVGRARAHEPDHRLLLGVGRQWPSYCAAEQRDELAALQLFELHPVTARLITIAG